MEQRGFPQFFYIVYEQQLNGKGCGQIIYWLRQYGASIANCRTVCEYLLYLIKKDNDDNYYKIITSNNLLNIALTNIKKQYRQEYYQNNSYIIIHNKIWGKAIKEDKRSASEIIKETFEQHKIQII